MSALPRIAVGPGDDIFCGTDLQIEALVQNDYRQRRQPDPGTVVESKKPSDTIGQFFEQFPKQHRDFRIHDLPTSPLKLFQVFLPESLVENWARYTNNTPGPICLSPSRIASCCKSSAGRTGSRPGPKLSEFNALLTKSSSNTAG
ncbi:hypothetical protein S40285_10884 [Stachybotrys chlorohalonatus IBT 40285]|uniref:PiggyBac transposable element-derived protein domain-containing protein n=1 Tax=Stachybotrys chlorohalonatus (strain IBT 40285) TaxID=1283841 RepID=A0A084QYP4_STAC4|nr:hypothetical protein S40285_10884 [Stachybotrys chlorohalonata IBT 40285]